MGKKTDKVFDFALRQALALGRLEVTALVVGPDTEEERNEAAKMAEIEARAFKEGARYAFAAVAAWINAGIDDETDDTYVIAGIFDQWLSRRAKDGE